MSLKTSRDSGRPWPRTQLAIALGLIPLGLITWFLGMVAAFAGDSARTPDWVVELGEFSMLPGLCIAAAGVVWLLVLLVRRRIGERSSPSKPGG
jgi:hypothetical protein